MLRGLVVAREIVREDVFFPCQGVECHAVIYRPREDGEYPGLVMAMGFGMVKDAHAHEYGPIFASHGIAVMAFDYRRFGRSGGEPRQALYPEDQVADYRCAIEYFKMQSYVDSTSVCVWGTSYSGGHVLTLLAFPSPSIKCGIAQVPSFYSFLAAKAFFGSLEPVMELAAPGVASACRGEPQYMPIVSREGLGLLRSEEAIEYYLEEASRVEGFENRVTIDSIPRILAYNPGYYADLVEKPLMIIMALRDRTVPLEPIREVASRVKGPIELVEVDAGHFDIYHSPLLEKIAGAEAKFILEQTGRL